jgi:hypothetical protein
MPMAMAAANRKKGLGVMFFVVTLFLIIPPLIIEKTLAGKPPNGRCYRQEQAKPHTYPVPAVLGAFCKTLLNLNLTLHISVGRARLPLAEKNTA